MIKLKQIKKTFIWYLFIKYFFIKIFDFIWTNIINFEGRVLGFIFKIKKKNYYIIKKFEDFKLINEDEDFIKMSNEIKKQLDLKFLDNIKKKLYSQKVSNDKSINQYNDYMMDFYPLLPNDLKLKIIEFALLEKNLLTATNYLNVLPIIKKIILYINVPKPKKEQGAQLWHKDDFGYKSLDIFLAITDIDQTNGPLYFVKSKNHLGVFSKLTNVIKNAKPGQRNKIDIDEFSKIYSQDEIGSLMGKSGTGIFIDSFTKYHRGGFCSTKDRIMLRISYQTPDSARGNVEIDKKKFYYFPNLKLDEVKNIFHKFVLFKKRNFFLKVIKIDKIILLIIKIFHYKI